MLALRNQCKLFPNTVRTIPHIKVPMRPLHLGLKRYEYSKPINSYSSTSLTYFVPKHRRHEKRYFSTKDASSEGFSWWKLIKYSFYAVGAASATAYLIVLNMNEGYNDHVFTNTLRVAALLQQPFTGISVSIGKASGRLLDGKVTLDNVKTSRKGHEELNWNMNIDHLEIIYKEDLRPWIKKPMDRIKELIHIQTIKIDGVKGKVELVAEDDKPKKDILMDTLEVSNMEMDIVDSRPKLMNESKVIMKNNVLVAFPTVKVKKFHAESVRSTQMLHDVLLKSFECEGSFGDGQISLTTQVKHDATTGLTRFINWKASSFPLGTVHYYLVPPLSWLKEVKLDLDVEAIHNMEPLKNPTKEYTVNVNMNLHGIQTVELDEVSDEQLQGMSLTKVVSGGTMLAFFNAHPRQLPLSFSFKVTEDQLDMKLVMNKIAQELMRQAMEKSGKWIMDQGKKNIAVLVAGLKKKE